MCSIIVPVACSLVLAADPSLQPQGQRITPKNLQKLRPLETLNKEAWRIVLRPNGKWLAFVRWEKPIELLYPGTLQPVRQAESGDPSKFQPLRKVGNDKTIGFAFSRNPNIVAYSTNGGGAFLVDLRTDKENRLDVSDQASLAFSPNGKQLVTGSYNGGAKVWSTKTRKLLRNLDTGRIKGGLTPVFSPDGKVLAIGHRNSTTRLFDPSTGRLLHTLGRKMSHGLAFHPNGKTLAIVYVDAGVALWDVATGKLLSSARSDAKELFTVCWSPDGTLLATAGLRGSVTLRSPEGLKPLKKLTGPEAVFTVSFTPDGTQILAGGGSRFAGGRRKVWRWAVR